MKLTNNLLKIDNSVLHKLPDWAPLSAQTFTQLINNYLMACAITKDLAKSILLATFRPSRRMRVTACDSLK